jgi:signal transduction histidine kinase
LRTLAPVNRTLPDALRELAEDATSPGTVDVTVAVNGRPREVGQDVAHHLLRIAQEATNNAIRHGHARHVTIDLDCHGHSLTLRVRDDGCGFAAETQVTDSTRDRWGLVNIRERAERVGGTLSLVSFPGKGTVVEVAVPLG